MKKLYFIAGSQDLYGEAVLKTGGKGTQRISPTSLTVSLHPQSAWSNAATVRDSDEARTCS